MTEQPSRKFIRFAEQYLDDGKADPCRRMVNDRDDLHLCRLLSTIQTFDPGRHEISLEGNQTET